MMKITFQAFYIVTHTILLSRDWHGLVTFVIFFHMIPPLLLMAYKMVTSRRHLSVAPDHSLGRTASIGAMYLVAYPWLSIERCSPLIHLYGLWPLALFLQGHIWFTWLIIWYCAYLQCSWKITIESSAKIEFTWYIEQVVNYPDLGQHLLSNPL